MLEEMGICLIANMKMMYLTRDFMLLLEAISCFPKII